MRFLAVQDGTKTCPEWQRLPVRSRRCFVVCFTHSRLLTSVLASQLVPALISPVVVYTSVSISALQ